MNQEESRAKQVKEAEMKIYTPRHVIQKTQESAVLEHAPVRIYEKPTKPNQPHAPLG
jgi:hypothetical protein